MGHGPGVREQRFARIVTGALLSLVCVAFLLPFAADAGPGYNPSAQPTRPYGAIDVILYRTSW